MPVDRQIGLVFIFDACATPHAVTSKAGGEVRSRVIRWIQHGSLPATFAVTNPLDHPWAADVHTVPHAEVGLLIHGGTRGVWQQAAERLEHCRESNLEIKSAVVVGDQVPSRDRRPLGLDTWAYWRPSHHLQTPVQPWRDRDGWQVPLRNWSAPTGSRSSSGWWRVGQVNWASQLPPSGRRYSWVFPVMSYDAGQLQNCEKMLKQLSIWQRQGLVSVQNLSQTALQLNAQDAPQTQHSILRAA